MVKMVGSSYRNEHAHIWLFCNTVVEKGTYINSISEPHLDMHSCEKYEYKIKKLKNRMHQLNRHTWHTSPLCAIRLYEQIVNSLDANTTGLSIIIILIFMLNVQSVSSNTVWFGCLDNLDRVLMSSAIRQMMMKQCVGVRSFHITPFGRTVIHYPSDR